MYCMHCGSKNPDTARFCNNCGKALNSAPAKKSGGSFVKRMIISIVVFGVFYGVGYVINSDSSGNNTGSKKDSSVFSEMIQIKPEVVKVTEPEEKEGYLSGITGSWEQVTLRSGDSSMNVSALSLSQTIYNCTGFTVEMEVTMNANTHCKDWQVWGRTGGKFVKIGKIYLPNGDGYVSQKLTFAKPVSFDSIAVTPTVPGGYSWSMWLNITDIYTK